MSRIEIRRQRFVKNRPLIRRYSFIDGPNMRGGRGVMFAAGRWIAHVDYRVRPLPESWLWEEL